MTGRGGGKGRKAGAPPTLSVPGVRALITEGDREADAAIAPPKPAAAKPRKRKPKFVF